MNINIPRNCKYCSSNQTAISRNQEYIYCLDCQKSNFYKKNCLCGGFDYKLKSPDSYAVTCTACGIHSWVPEFIEADQNALEFIEKMQQESQRRNLNKKPKLQLSFTNIVVLCLLLFCWVKY
jgi:hypothetical protein